MANYAVQKAKYGGVVGSIQVFTTDLPTANLPDLGDFRTKLPAGFLRCDGSILKQDLYPALAEVLGVGSDSKFAKIPEEMADDEFQLPDIGAKYLVPGAATGTYLSQVLSDGVTPRIGAEFDVRSNIGTTQNISYSGNFTIDTFTDDLEGFPLFTGPENTPTAIITDQHYQGHGHTGNQAVLNCTGNFVVSPGIGPTDAAESYSGNNCRPFAGNLLYRISAPDDTTVTGASHDHRVQVPTSPLDYTSNMQFTYPTTQIPASNIRTEITLDVKDPVTFDSTVAPFMIVEYIIKI